MSEDMDALLAGIDFAKSPTSDLANRKIEIRREIERRRQIYMELLAQETVEHEAAIERLGHEMIGRSMLKDWKSQ